MYRQRKQLTQIPEKPGKKPGFFNREEQKEYYSKLDEIKAAQQQVQAEEEFNKKVDRRQQLGSQLGVPQAIRNDYTRAVGDRIVDAEAYLRSPQFQTNALQAAALGGTVLAGKAGVDYLGAMNDQQSDYQPTDPFSVAGRMVSNARGVDGAVGLDPLASARNKVSEARKLVGSEAMLEILATDEIVQMRGEQEMAMTPVEFQQAVAVQSMIDQRVEQLMGQPIQKADGSVAPMQFDTAQRLATEQVHMELRAAGTY